ncbi:MAG: motility protein A [Clostridia bacterium]|nr:motility protein A [Clostridia bacterium]
MDFSGLVGLVVGAGLIVYGILSGGAIGNFIDVGSIAITVGGTVAATVMSFPFGTFKYIPSHFKIMFSKSKHKPQDYIEKVVDYAQEARRKGLLTLEDKANQEDDEFFKNSIMLIVDAIEPTKVKEMLENELDCLEQRHAKGWQLYEKAASFAPAYGMIGTLIGLINMLKNLDMSSSDAAAGVGQGMSVALITTFYGSLLANLILMPIANKLKIKHYEEMVCKEVIVEGVLSIHAGTNPRHIEDRLKAFVNSKERVLGPVDGDGGDNKKGKKPKKEKSPKGKKGE